MSKMLSFIIVAAVSLPGLANAESINKVAQQLTNLENGVMQDLDYLDKNAGSCTKHYAMAKEMAFQQAKDQNLPDYKSIDAKMRVILPPKSGEACKRPTDADFQDAISSAKFVVENVQKLRSGLSQPLAASLVPSGMLKMFQAVGVSTTAEDLILKGLAPSAEYPACKQAVGGAPGESQQTVVYKSFKDKLEQIEDLSTRYLAEANKLKADKSAYATCTASLNGSGSFQLSSVEDAASDNAAL